MPGYEPFLLCDFHVHTQWSDGKLSVAEVVDLYGSTGKFDVIAIDPNAETGGIRLFGETESQSVLDKILYTASRANIAAVWVDGHLAV